MSPTIFMLALELAITRPNGVLIQQCLFRATGAMVATLERALGCDSRERLFDADLQLEGYTLSCIMTTWT